MKLETLWRFVDGKPGHDNQTLGLVNALRNLTAFACYDVPVQPGIGPLLRELRGVSRARPKPDLLIGAGHATHLPMLLARQRYGGRAVVLMQPSLPSRWFDLCLIPAHDRAKPNERTLITQGVLNSIVPSQVQQADEALILVGGPSRHFHWDDRALWRMIERLIEQNPAHRFHLGTSRRTPAGFLQQQPKAGMQRLTITPYAQTGPGWVNQTLAQCGTAWISADSVSMVYEALTAGCAVAVLPLPERRPSRVSRGLDQLIEAGQVSLFDNQGSYRRQMRPATGFNEAKRCAEWLINYWVNSP